MVENHRYRTIYIYIYIVQYAWSVFQLLVAIGQKMFNSIQILPNLKCHRQKDKG